MQGGMVSSAVLTSPLRKGIRLRPKDINGYPFSLSSLSNSLKTLGGVLATNGNYYTPLFGGPNNDLVLAARGWNYSASTGYGVGTGMSFGACTIIDGTFGVGDSSIYLNGQAAITGLTGATGIQICRGGQAVYLGGVTAPVTVLSGSSPTMLVNPSSATYTALRIKEAATPTAAPLQFHTSGGVETFAITPGGRSFSFFNNNSNYNYIVQLDSGALTDRPGFGFAKSISAATTPTAFMATIFPVGDGTANKALLCLGNGTYSSTVQYMAGATPGTAAIRGCSGSGTNIAGANLELAPGIGTGNAVPACTKIQGTALGGSSGSTAQTLVDRHVTSCTKVLTNNTNTALVNCTIANGSVIGGILNYCIEVTDGTDYQVEQGTVSFITTNKAGTIANNTTVKDTNQQAMTAGTLTATFTITAANPAVVTLNANSSLTPSTGFPRITYSIENLTQQAIAIR